jgi:CRISPR-associated protein Cas1
MIKKTLYFGNPAYLSRHNEQLVISLPDAKGKDTAIAASTIPIEDIGVIVLDNYQVTITHSLIQMLLENNVAIITCNTSHQPAGLMLNLSGNTTQTERFREQIEASEPLRKQMWQQTIKAKITNQAENLKQRKVNIQNMLHWVDEVKSGDSDNHEARAAAYYWGNIFPSISGFRRDRDGLPPNNLLNYGYAILRGVIARSLVASGLLPTLGIHHHNRYNAYCLADDIMEPYRPYVDKVVMEIVDSNTAYDELTKELKAKLLGIPAMDVVINDQRSPLMIAAQMTTASVYKCFEGTVRKITYPE